MRKIILLLGIYLCLTLNIFAQDKQDSAPAKTQATQDAPSLTAEAVEAQQQAILSAQFSPRWLITYADDLYARGNKEMSTKVLAAAQSLTEVFRDDISKSTDIKDPSAKEKVAKYTQAMLKFIGDLAQFYKTGDKSLEAAIEKDQAEVLANDLK